MTPQSILTRDAPPAPELTVDDMCPQLFSKANRDGIKAGNPGADFGEIGKLLALAWKEASAEERAPFEAAHAVCRPPCLCPSTSLDLESDADFDRSRCRA